MERRIGRPPKYTDPSDMQIKIDEYFRDCDERQKPYTVTGLALALGFTSRQNFLEYQARAPYTDTITRAKARVEQYAEERLYDSQGANGAKFSLANNFKGWKESQNVELGGSVVIEGDVRD